MVTVNAKTILNKVLIWVRPSRLMSTLHNLVGEEIAQHRVDTHTGASGVRRSASMSWHHPSHGLFCILYVSCSRFCTRRCMLSPCLAVTHFYYSHYSGYLDKLAAVESTQTSSLVKLRKTCSVGLSLYGLHDLCCHGYNNCCC